MIQMNLLKKATLVLDSDVTVGEQPDGMYRVFVEIERNKSAPIIFLK